MPCSVELGGRKQACNRTPARLQEGRGAYMKCEKAPLEDGSILLCTLCANSVHVSHAEQIKLARQQRVVWPWNVFQCSGSPEHAIAESAARPGPVSTDLHTHDTANT